MPVFKLHQRILLSVLEHGHKTRGYVPAPDSSKLRLGYNSPRMKPATADMRGERDADAGRCVCSSGSSGITYKASNVYFTTPLTCIRSDAGMIAARRRPERSQILWVKD